MMVQCAGLVNEMSPPQRWKKAPQNTGIQAEKMASQDGLDLAISMVSPMIFGLVVGLYLDKVFHTPPVFMLGLTLLGVATGFWSIIKRAYNMAPPPNPPGEKKTKPDSSDGP
jgi:F0F1-type ATP synthase assembly protein I